MHVCLLKQSLYYLKQARSTCMVWISNSNITSTWFFIVVRHMLLYLLQNATNILLVLVHVDDVIIIGNNDNFLQNIIHQLSSTFALKDLGNYDTFLYWGSSIQRRCLPFTIEVHQWFAHQSSYARLLSDCHSNATQGCSIAKWHGCHRISGFIWKFINILLSLDLILHML